MAAKMVLKSKAPMKASAPKFGGSIGTALSTKQPSFGGGIGKALSTKQPNLAKGGKGATKRVAPGKYAS